MFLMSVVELALAISCLSAFFLGAPSLALVVGGIRLAMDLLAMAAGALKPPVPLLTYVIGAVLISPWYLGIAVGGSFGTLLEAPMVVYGMVKAKQAGEGNPSDHNEPI